MVYVDTEEVESYGDLVPGVYPVRIRSCKEKTSKSSGEPMFAAELENAQTGEKLCYLNIMLGGKGFGMGKATIKAFLGPTQGDLQPEKLVHKQAWAALKIDEYEGKARLAVDTKRGKAGLWPWDSQHEDVIAAREHWERAGLPPF